MLSLLTPGILVFVYSSIISSKNQDFRVTIWLLGNVFMSWFRAFIGSNPPSLTLFAFLYRRKEKRFVHRYFHPENEKNGLRGSRSTAPKPDFSVVCPFFAEKAGKNVFCLGRQKTFFSCERARKRCVDRGKKREKVRTYTTYPILFTPITPLRTSANPIVSCSVRATLIVGTAVVLTDVLGTSVLGIVIVSTPICASTSSGNS